MTQAKRHMSVILGNDNSGTLSRYSLERIGSQIDYTKRKTSIICTMGPSCWDVENLVTMMKTGMGVCRLNFSHGDHKTHGETIQRIREAQKQTKKQGCDVAIMLDTKGPEIRTGFLENGQPIQLKAGQLLEISTDYELKGNDQKIACSYAKLCTSVKVGSQILIADGSLVCEVREILEKSVKVEVLNDAKLGERKNMNLPGIKVDLPVLLEKDKSDIVDFGLPNGIDMIALSFTQSADDVHYVRELMGVKGKNVKIICKIENQEGLKNYEDILKVADGIMVARGDLGMEIPPQKVFVAQKWMISKANAAGIPVITATQMMESIISNPRPTRAEASDIANAVLDGTDAVMLSGETAGGKFPLIAVDTMAKICCEAESCIDYEAQYWNIQKQKVDARLHHNSKEALSACAVQLSFEIGAQAIICFTQSGTTARLIAKYRPAAHIFAISDVEGSLKDLLICRGVHVLGVPSFQGGEEVLINYAISVVKSRGYIQSGQQVIVMMGSGEDAHNNMIKITDVE